MEFTLITFGVLIGKVWTWLLARQFQTARITRRAPALQLGAYITVAVLTGVVIGFIEVHVFSPGRMAGALSKGLIAGFTWSPWFISSVRLLYSRRQTARAAAYLFAAPALVLAAVLGGYLSLNLELRLT